MGLGDIPDAMMESCALYKALARAILTAELAQLPCLSLPLCMAHTELLCCWRGGRAAAWMSVMGWLT